MSLKKKLVTAVASAALGLSLIGGGTYAYFNDTEEASSTFANGLLDLGINEESIINIENLVPGDTINGNFELTNDGTVDMKEVVLHSSYDVTDKYEPNNGDDLGDHIKVVFLYKPNGKETIISSQMLSELNNNPITLLDGFPVGSKAETFTVRFEFVEDGGNQNHFQGDALKLNWKFEAVQRDGKPNFK